MRRSLSPLRILMPALITASWAIGREGAGAEAETQGGKAMEFTLTSSAFTNGQAIPPKHTGDGPDVSPALQWTDPPPGTKAFVLICDDPDAPIGDWVHWVIYDIPPETRKLEENVPRTPTVLGSAKQGINDFRKTGYWGPAPPPGKPHRYFFKLYAVARPVGLPPGATKRQALKAIEGHVLKQAELMGTYKR